MGMSVSSGGSTRPGRFTSVTLAEINVTPLVDVMLVLLVVFMLSAPLMQQGIQVDLPKANATALNDTPEQLMLVVNREHRISINGNRIEPGTLHTKLKAIAKVRPDVQVYIQADQRVEYGYIAQVMAEVKRSGITRVGLVTEPGDNTARL